MNMQPSGRFVYFNTDVTFFDNVFLIMELVTGLQIIAEPGIQVCVSLFIIMIQMSNVIINQYAFFRKKRKIVVLVGGEKRLYNIINVNAFVCILTAYGFRHKQQGIRYCANEVFVQHASVVPVDRNRTFAQRRGEVIKCPCLCACQNMRFVPG